MKNSILTFFVSFVLIGGVLFFFPINFFSGEIVENSSGISKTISVPLSLSYFIGIGYDDADMHGVQSFYLTGQGYALAFCLLIGIPFLISLRVYYRNKIT